MGLVDANSTELDEKTPHPAVVFMPEINPDIMGGTMRLGSRETIVSLKHKDGSMSLGAQVYGLESEAEGRVAERHRHRYEVNPQLVSSIESSGLFFSGKDETDTRMEIAELPTQQHPYYLGVQFHPEFKSRPNRPSPPFFGLVAVAAGRASEMRNAGALWRTGVSARPPMSPREMSQPSASLPTSPTPYRKRPASAISSAQTSPARVDANASQERSQSGSPSVPLQQPAGKCATLAPFKGL
jgi:CTP synthase